MKPFLKYVGGKTWLIPQFQSLTTDVLTNETVLVELFCGSGAISLGLEHPNVILNDVNRSLMQLWHNIQEGKTPKLISCPDSKFYAETRDAFNLIKDDVIIQKDTIDVNAGDLYYFLNKFAFNGLYRENKKGKFNASWNNATKSIEIDWECYQSLIAKWELHNQNFIDVSIPDNALIYADPPYDDTFANYSKGGFNFTQQENLALHLSNLAKKGIPIIASNSWTERIVNLYENLGFAVLSAHAPRRISCDGNRDDAKEMIAHINLHHGNVND